MNALTVMALGAAQLGMAGLGLAVPALLRFREGLVPLRPMLRRLFWTYGAYVLGTNLFFGVVLVLRPDVLLEPGVGALALALYLFLFWGVRLVLELAGFDADAVPPVWWAVWGRRGLMLLLAVMTFLYGLLAWRALP